MQINQVHAGQSSEGATIITLGLILLSDAMPILQALSYIAATVLACGTIFLNRKKYWEEVKKTQVYKWINSWLREN
jgi:hypothetical protein